MFELKDIWRGNCFWICNYLLLLP